jgi:bifunctional DNA-binding transcriptional regulator/antitoxin component of YhaV-PrlF toxin-antitoxin module
MEVLYMTEKGQVTVPSAARARRKLGYKSTLVFLESASGDMILRPSKASPELDLVDHLRRFKGMEIPERKHMAPPRV